MYMEQTLSNSDQKTEFISNIKKWVLLEKQLKLVNEKGQEIRNQKFELSEKIMDYMESNHILEKPIVLSDGEIKIVDKKTTTPLSFSYVEECLEKLISDKNHVDTIMKYLYDNRETTYVSELKRTYKK